MSTWSRSYTLHTTATPAQVWARWTDASTWAEDDPGVVWAAFDDAPRTGTGGRVKNPGTPAQRFEFTAVEHERRMDFVLRLPLARLSVEHLMEQEYAGLAVTHGVRIEGPLAPVYGVLVGRSLAAGLPEVVRTVVAAALATGHAAERP